MRTILALAALLLPASVSAQQAEIGVYHQTLLARDSASTNVVNYDFVQGYAYLNSKIGVWGFAYREKGYFSSTAGLYYDILPWLEVGAAAGVEVMNSKSYFRWAGLLWTGTEKLFLEVYYENGTSKESWYYTNLMWRSSKHLGAGILSQRFAGTGPRVLVQPLKGVPLEVWVAPLMYEYESKSLNTLLGIQLILQKR